MCGIAGFITGGKKNYDASKFVSNSFIAGSLRGVHSSGIAVVNVDKGVYEAHKLPVNGTFFIEDGVAKRLLSAAQNEDHFTIAHTRHATVGNVGYSTAHPFEIAEEGRTMVGVHNGTLTGWSYKKNGKYYNVDSEWALNHIFDEGEDAFKDFTGAFAFVWWDSENNDVLNIALNDQRPMHVAFLEDGGMAYASEAGMLYWLLERNSIKLDGKIRKLTAGFHYQFDKKDLKKYSKKSLPKPTQASNYPRTTRTYATGTYKTVVDKVQELIDKVSGKKEALPSPTVTREELENAKNLSVHMEEGVFAPKLFTYTTGELSGTFTASGMEWDAVIRNCHNLSWKATQRFKLKLLGVKDENDALIAVLPPPVKSNIVEEEVV